MLFCVCRRFCRQIPAYWLLLGDAAPTVTFVHFGFVALGLAVSLRQTADSPAAAKALVKAATPMPGMAFALFDRDAGLWGRFEPIEARCFGATCALCLVGASVYASRWPDPFPRIFGFHEVFHLCIVVAQLCTFTANYNIVVRSGMS